MVGSFNFSDKALIALKSSVREYIQNENGFNRMHKKQLQTQLTNAKNRLDHAVNLLLDGVLTKETYETQKQKLDNEIAEIEKELIKCSDNLNEIGEIIENIIELVGNTRNLIRSSKTDPKRAFLKLILSNSTITDKKAWISLKKPFDLLQKSNGCTSWLCYLYNSRAELFEIRQVIDDIKKKSITYSNDFIRISSANLSMSVVHPLHQSKHSKN